jgi:uncharacterized membrane protein (DUF4010 family)
MNDLTTLTNSLGAALGIGLLVGLERERKKGEGPKRGPAGLRTFATTALLGFASMYLGEVLLLGAAMLALGALLTTAYFKSRDGDPGMTTEVAQMLVLMLGGLCVTHAELAVAIGIILTILLACRQSLHDFARQQLSENEIRDALILATAALVILPLVPDRYIGPLAAINLRTIWQLTVLMMVIGSAGHIAMRLLGQRYGLAITGFASGFASSTATIGSLGSRTRASPELLSAATTGALLSSVSTLIQMAVLLAAVTPAMLLASLIPLCAGGITLLAYTALFLRRNPTPATGLGSEQGAAFSLPMALLLALGITGISLLSSLLLGWAGQGGLIAVAAFGGLIDAHSSAVSIAGLVKAGKLSSTAAMWPILCALSSNTLAKCVIAHTSGSSAYARRIIPGLLLMLAAAWAATGLSALLP